MQAINQAYQVLSDPEARRSYDFTRGADAQPRASYARPEAGYARPAPRPQDSAEPTGSAQDYPPEHHPHANPHHRPSARQHQQMRLNQARANAWYILSRSLPTAIFFNVLLRFVVPFVSDGTVEFLLVMAGFIPVYAVLLAIIFLISPQIRLDLHDYMHHKLHRRAIDPQLTGVELGTLVALALAFIPLAVVWALFFTSL